MANGEMEMWKKGPYPLAPEATPIPAGKCLSGGMDREILHAP